MGGQNCSSKTELKKGPWTREEDHKLLAYVEIHGCGSWRTLPAKAGLQRCGKSCRLRWTNYLRPDITRGKFSTQEEKTIIRLHALLGNRWSTIAAHLPKRTDNEIKNYWNTHLKKRLTRMGIDPTNHKPKHDQAKSAALSHMAQWEAARLEAEARLARDSKRLPLLHKLAFPPPQPLRMASPPCLDVLRVWQSSTLQRRFFSSAGSSSLQSPTSTLNSSSSSRTVPAVSSIVANDVISTNDDYDACRLRRVDDSYQLHGEHMTYTDCGLMGPLDLAAFNHDSDGCSLGGPIVGEPEDSKNFWDYLLNLVNSPMMESPKL